MSYDITNHVFAARASADADAAAELRDRRLVEFLARLVAAELTLTEFEERFCTDVLYRHALRTQAGQPAQLSDGQRGVVEKMVKAYSARLPVKAESAREIPPHVSGTCGYLVRNEAGRLVRCGVSPVASRNSRGLEFCAEHTKQRDDWRKRQQEIRRRQTR